MRSRWVCRSSGSSAARPRWRGSRRPRRWARRGFRPRGRRRSARTGLPAAQILLAAGDVADRLAYVNARQAFAELFRLGAVPVVNENDATATDEITFGDNDALAAQVAVLVKARLLVLLTEVEGLYSRAPGTPGAELIAEGELAGEAETGCGNRAGPRWNGQQGDRRSDGVGRRDPDRDRERGRRRRARPRARGREARDSFQARGAGRFGIQDVAPASRSLRLAAFVSTKGHVERSSTRGRACSESGSSAVRAASSPGPRSSSWGRTALRSPRASPLLTRSGSRTARAASWPCTATEWCCTREEGRGHRRRPRERARARRRPRGDRARAGRPDRLLRRPDLGAAARGDVRAGARAERAVRARERGPSRPRRRLRDRARAVDAGAPHGRDAGVPRRRSRRTSSSRSTGSGAVRFCHGSPRSDEECVTPETPEERVREFSAGVDEPVIVSAHVHIQFDREAAGIRSVNAGSVGLPYEGRPRRVLGALGAGRGAAPHRVRRRRGRRALPGERAAERRADRRDDADAARAARGDRPRREARLRRARRRSPRFAARPPGSTGSGSPRSFRPTTSCCRRSGRRSRASPWSTATSPLTSRSSGAGRTSCRAGSSSARGSTSAAARHSSRSSCCPSSTRSPAGAGSRTTSATRSSRPSSGTSPRRCSSPAP